MVLIDSAEKRVRSTLQHVRRRVVCLRSTVHLVAGVCVSAGLHDLTVTCRHHSTLGESAYM